MSREAMKLALEALKKHGEAPKDWACKECVPFSDILKDGFQCKYHAAITALREALAEQPAPATELREQEPVAYGMWDTMLGKDHRMMMVRLDKGQDGCTIPLYTSPSAQRKPLTGERVREICDGSCYDKATMQERADFVNGIRHAEAAHGIKGDT